MDKEQAIMESTRFWEDPLVAGDLVDVLSFGAVFARRWPFLLLMGVFGFSIAAGVSFVLTPQYTSRTVFLPPSQPNSASDNPLAMFLRPPSSTIYTGLLTSDSVLTDVIEHTNLETIFKSRDIEQARQMLRSDIQVTTDTAGFVTLQVTYKDPKLAQQMASGFLDALSRLNDRLAVSEAEQHRAFFQAEFERAKNDLEKSEIELKKAQEASGVVSPESQTKSGLSAIDAARADIRAREITLSALLKSETDQSPEVQRLKSQISTEQAQLTRLENTSGSPAGSGLSAAQAPSVNLRFVQLDREVKYNQVLFDVMAKQYENARLQESSAAPRVQVVDIPEVPLHKSKPSHALYAIAGGGFGFVFAVFVVFVCNRLEVLRQDPVRAKSWRRFHEALLQPQMRP